MEKKEQTILQVTEAMVRQGGYNAFSFRDIAQKVGIKSSSVHYYFPTKEDLGAAVAKYYTDKFLASLGSPTELIQQGKNPIEHYVNAIRQAVTKDKRMCLCGMLGAEANGLPKRVVVETQAFFTRNLEWLEQAYTAVDPAIVNTQDAKQKAVQTLSLLEGAMITCNILEDTSLFEHAADLIMASVQETS